MGRLLERVSPSLFAAWLLAPAVLAAAEEPAGPFELQKGDRVCFIGNTLAERMQHGGWLETLLQVRFPDHELVVRNLGFSGDELTLRLRSAGFGSPDEHLAFNRADVIFAFFGYNESFGDEAGLAKFKQDLADFIQHTRGQKYNGASPPRLVLFSPIAHEDLGDPNLPDGAENNRRIALYTDAMREVAAALGCAFVDLYRPTLDLYARIDAPLTINGVHLNDLGDRNVASIVDEALFGPGAASASSERLDAVREAVLEKNFYWFNRYRTVDGYSTYGGRADLKFVDGQTNREVMQRELEVLDVMTANRDRKIWAAAQGLALIVDDENAPPFIPVKTNKPGAGPNGEHLFVDPEEAIGMMTVARGMRVNLVASEREFPELINPVQMAFDPQGRLWVAVWPTYPHWRPKEEMNDKLLILEDDDGDGVADRVKVFADGLHNPTGFEFWGGGVFVAMAPDLFFLKDTDGDDRADVRVRVLGGLDSADTHHAANSFTLDPTGALYFQEGTFHHTQVETPYGPPRRCANAGVFRYEPRTQKFDVYVTHPFANPHGHVFDRWGQDFVYDGTGSNPYHATLFSGRLEFPKKHATPPQIYQQRTRPCPGVEILSSRHFPDELQGNLLVGNVIGFQGILQYKLHDQGASFGADEVEPILFSSDPNFRPSDLEMGPDGALWFTDWHNPIIGHMQHNLRDPSRDRKHGRVYRVAYEGRPLLQPARIAGEPVDRLLELLKSPEDRTRYRTRIELSARPTAEVMTALDRWLAALDPSDPDFEHHRLEGLWLRANHNVVDLPLLEAVLGSPDFRARAAATRVLCDWRDRVPSALDLLLRLAEDSHPRVRLEAVRAASYFPTTRAMQIPLAAARRPADPYIDFTRAETMKALEPILRAAILEGRDVAAGGDAELRLLLRNVSTADLIHAPKSRAVALELLTRKGTPEEIRGKALVDLAEFDGKPRWHALLAALELLDAEDSDDGVVYDLARLLLDEPAEDLLAARAPLAAFAESARRPLSRQTAYAALVAADRSIDGAWTHAARSHVLLRDLVLATPLIKDLGLRTEMFARVQPLLRGLPALVASAEPPQPTQARFVRIELSGRRTLTLAEVEVYSDGENVAPVGRATQKNTAFRAGAERAVDGNASGAYADGGQTHTVENTPDPWWELDLGEPRAIEAVVVHNRTDGDLGKRLDGFSLLLLDEKRGVVFRKDQIPAPDPKTSIAVGPADPATALRRAAMTAMVSVPGKESQAFQEISRFVLDGTDSSAAVHALLAVPAAFWNADAAPALAAAVLESLRALPPSERTSAPALDAMQFVESLAGLLPPEAAAHARRELRDLGVQVVRISTLTDRMLYDKEFFAVQAGKPVEIVFQNTDVMPHNLVVAEPGALEEVGALAESMATHPSAVERHYVPQSQRILVASRLLQPRVGQRLRFTAPQKPGVYPYVCTYPGHWRRMFGAMLVVEDLDAYLADPSKYLAERPLEPLDPMLKTLRPRKEWTFEDLAPSLSELARGRSFASAKQVFQIANCTACHRMNGVGYEIGPDLAKLDPKISPEEILRSVVEPSAKIDPKYATSVLETESGRIVTGLVIEETDDVVKLVENPLVQSEPIVVPKQDIADRQVSKTSIMPLGMLDRLTREEALDLLAYLVARGDPADAVFSGQGGHGH